MKLVKNRQVNLLFRASTLTAACNFFYISVIIIHILEGAWVKTNR